MAQGTLSRNTQGCFASQGSETHVRAQSTLRLRADRAACCHLHMFRIFTNHEPLWEAILAAVMFAASHGAVCLTSLLVVA